MADVYLGLGSNVRHKKANLRNGLNLLEGECRIVRVSSLYITEPVGYKHQEWFVNAAAEIEVDLKPRGLFSLLQSIERQLGRTETIRYGPRTLDLDILFYDDLVINEADLTIPHPRLHERKFVLAPLEEIAPDLVHPVLQKPIRELAQSVTGREVVKLCQTAWQSA